MTKNIIMRIEPSKRLSELLGFPYFIEKRFSVEDLIQQGIINVHDIAEMESGKEISKSLRYSG